MDNQNILKELIETYRNYKKGEYTFGKYGTGEQIERAFVEGKIFVLKGAKNIFSLFIIIPILYAILIPLLLSSRELYDYGGHFMILLIMVSIEIPILMTLIPGILIILVMILFTLFFDLKPDKTEAIRMELKELEL